MRRTSRGTPFLAVGRPAGAAAALPSGKVIVAAAFAVPPLVAAVLAGVVFSAHDRYQHTLNTELSAAQAAVDWTGTLINLNNDNIDTGLAKLRDDTIGDLNSHFQASIAPERDALRSLQARSQGHIRSVSIESVHHDPDTDRAAQAPRNATVLIVATSVGDDASGAPHTIEWNLRIGVIDVDGRLLISQLEPIR